MQVNEQPAHKQKKLTNAEIEFQWVPRNWLFFLMGLLVAAAFLAVDIHFLHIGLSNGDALDYAQIGRNLANGRGFSTSILRPLALTHGANPLQQPDVTHGPFYPFMLALGFGIGGVHDSTVIAISGLCFIVCVVLTYVLGKSLFSPIVGIVAALVFMSSITILEYAASGTPIMLSAAVLTGLFVQLYRAFTQQNRSVPKLVGVVSELLYLSHAPFGLQQQVKSMEDEQVSLGALAAAGILAGLLYLVDPTFIWLLPILAIGVCQLQQKNRGLHLAVFVVPIVILISPWMVRNALLTGNPVFGLRGEELFMGTSVYPGFSAYRMLPAEIPPSQPIFQSLLPKFLTGIGVGINELAILPAPWILLFLVPSLFFRFSSNATNILRKLSIFCLFGIQLGQLLFDPNTAMVLTVLPVLIVFSVAYLMHLVESSHINRLSQGIACGLFALGLLCPLLLTCAQTKEPVQIASANVARNFAHITQSGETSFSDQPWIVAWYADRPSIWIPKSDSKVGELRKRFNVHWLYLTNATASLSDTWQELYQGIYSWNIMYVRSLGQKTSAPKPLLVKDPQQPLLNALDGFVTMAPVETWPPSAVIAKASKP